MIRRALIASAAAVAFSSPALAIADATEWTDSTGSFTVEAEFIRLDGDTVILKQTSGDELEIPLEKLAKADQDRAKKLAAAASSPFKTRKSSPFKTRDSGGAMKDTDRSDSGAAASGRSRGLRELTLRGSASERLQPDEVDLTWSIEPDGSDVELGLPKSGLRFKSGKSIHDRVKRIAIDRAAGRAVVGVAVHKFSDPAEGTLFSVIDLKDGDALNPVRVDGTQIPFALTQGGSMLVTGESAFGFGKSVKMTCYEVGPRSIDAVWSVEPFTDRQGNPEKDVAYGMLLAEDVAMALNGRGSGVFFDPQSGEIISEVELGDWEARPTLSAGGKYLVMTGEVNVAVYDAKTLEPVAAVETPVGMNPVSARFSTDGTRLMAVGRDRLAVFDGTTGELLGETLHGTSFRDLEESLAHAGGDYYFVGGRLLNLKEHIPVWDYSQTRAVTDFNGKTLFFYDRVPGQTGSSLAVAGELPHKAPRQAVEDATKDPDLFALKPGDTISVDLGAVATKAGVEEARRLIIEWANDNDITIGDGSNKKLVGTMRQGEEQTREYRSMGFGRGGSETVRYRPQIATMRLMVGGQEAWSLERSSGGPSFMLNMKDGETAQQAVNRQTKGTDARILGGMHPPAYVLSPKFGGNTLGTSSLGPRGLIDRRNTSQ